jgi:hypothetical protein
MLVNERELFLKADEAYLVAIRLNPTRPPMRVPTLLAGGLGYSVMA